MNIQSIQISNQGIEKSLGQLEASIMEVLWSSDEPQSARAITDTLSKQKKTSFNAITTVLNRLEKKGLISRKAVGKRYSFSANQTKEEYSRSIINSGLYSLLSDKTLLSAAGFSGGDTSKDLNPETLKILKDFIKTHEDAQSS